MKVDYLADMPVCVQRTGRPRPIQLAEDDIIKVTYDAQAMRWILNRPSRIKYPTARELIKQYRKEYAERLG
jgi:hypothetical protein